MDDIILAVIAKLQTAFPTTTVVYGAVPQAPTTSLPLITVAPMGTEFSIKGTGGLREERQEIEITLLVSLKEYFEDSADNVVDSVQALVQMMEDRAVDGLPATTTILGAINGDVSIGGTVMNILEFRIRYDTIPTSRIGSATLTILTTRIIPNNC